MKKWNLFIYPADAIGMNSDLECLLMRLSSAMQIARRIKADSDKIIATFHLYLWEIVHPAVFFAVDIIKVLIKRSQTVVTKPKLGPASMLGDSLGILARKGFNADRQAPLP